MNQTDKIYKIYKNLSRFEKIKWNLGINEELEKLPQSKSRMEKEKYWYKK